MLNFKYYNPTRLVFGKDTISELDKLVPKKARVLITYGSGSVKRNGCLDKVKDSLKDRVVFEFDGIEPNPEYETLMKAVSVIRANDIDFILAVGGGSVIDGSKFINLALAYNNDSDAYTILFKPLEAYKIKGKFLPLATVLTLPATGSESNKSFVISNKGLKTGLNHEKNYPTFSILDPELTYSLPKTQLANGLADSFIHVTEQYLTSVMDAKFQDRTAEGILMSLIEISGDVLSMKKDYNTRANFMFLANQALSGLIGSGVESDWVTHKLGHVVTAITNLDHGKTLSVILPNLWTIQFDKRKDKLEQYGKRVFNLTGDNIAKRAIEETRAFFNSIGMKDSLSGYGITKEELESIIQSAIHTHKVTNFISSEEIEKVYRISF